ncbi:hypothetical protein D3C87_2046580 [compost metagenome]
MLTAPSMWRVSYEVFDRTSPIATFSPALIFAWSSCGVIPGGSYPCEGATAGLMAPAAGAG